MDWLDKAKRNRDKITAKNIELARIGQATKAEAYLQHRRFIESNSSHLKEVVQRVEGHGRRIAELYPGFHVSSGKDSEGYEVIIHTGTYRRKIRWADQIEPLRVYIIPSQPGFIVDFRFNRGAFNTLLIRKRFNIDAITDDRILQWLQWLLTGGGRPWGWWGYSQRSISHGEAQF